MIARPINSFFQNLLKKAPLLETIYSSVKDLMNTFVGKKKGFQEAVFVKIFENSTIERIGFITNKDLAELNINNITFKIFYRWDYSIYLFID